MSVLESDRCSPAEPATNRSADDVVERPEGHAAKKHLRGSSLLLVGRGLAVAINFGVQVLVVRFLSVAEFGAFAFGIATVALLTKMSELGLGKGLGRNMSIYHEQKDYGRLFGALVLGLGTVFGLGSLLALGMFVFRDLLAQRVVSSPEGLNVLLIMVMLTPLQALEDVLEKTFAVFAKARAVFFRRHLLGPLLKLGAVAVLIVFKGNVYVLAWAYLAASVVGACVSLALLAKILRQQKLFDHFHMSEVRIPAKEVFGFSIPLISSDLAFVFRVSLIVLFLEMFLGNAAVAAFRAVFPVARLNVLVFDSFKTLFLPWASRLYARREHAELNELYWRNATWLAVLSFPVFLVTFSLALPTTTLLFGERYAHSAPILAVLSLGCYVNVLFGFSSLTLRVYGNVRALVAVDIVTAIVALGLGLALIPWLGAIGGAVATAVSLALQNGLYQALLIRTSEVRMLDARFTQVMATVLVSTAVLFLVQSFAQPAMWAMALLAIVASAVVVGVNLRHLDLEATFPELRRFAAARYLFDVGGTAR